MRPLVRRAALVVSLGCLLGALTDWRADGAWWGLVAGLALVCAELASDD